MLNSLQRAYLKQVAIKYMPLTIAVLLAFITWSNYAYHGWKGLLGPLALCVAMIAYAVHLLQEGDETNKQIRQRLFEETTRANRLEMERRALEVEVDRLSRPPNRMVVSGDTRLLLPEMALVERIAADAAKGPA